MLVLYIYIYIYIYIAGREVYGRDMVELAGFRDESRCCILNGLQFCHQITGDTDREAVAVVKSTADECAEQCLRRVRGSGGSTGGGQ